MTAMILIAAASIGAFLLVFWLVGVVSVAKSAIAKTRGALQAMRDPELDELTREKSVQSAAIQLFILSGSLILRSLVALFAGFVPILAADWAQIVPRSAMMAFIERWEVILIASAVVTVGYVVGVRVWSR